MPARRTTFKRVARRVGRKIYKAAKKRYYNKKTGFNVSQIASDVSLLKRMVNAEKKHFGPVAVSSAFPVGQINVNAEGTYCVDISPAMGRGLTRDSRNGNSIKLHSMHLSLQLVGQSGQTNRTKLSVELWYPVKDIVAPSTAIGQLYKYDPFISDNITTVLHDFMSGRDPDYFTQYRMLAKRIVHVVPDPAATDTEIRTISIGKMFKNFHMRWNDSGALADGQILLLIRADTGNCGVSTSSNPNVPQATAQTGFNGRWTADWYFYDN